MPEETPEERAADIERRWIEECRAHGETRARLELALRILAHVRPGDVPFDLRDPLRTLLHLNKETGAR